MQSMIKIRLNSENCSMSEAANAPYVCSTFVVAKMAKHTDGPPTVFRSYSGKGIQSSQCAIWQAARATTAAPSFFKEMYIDNPRPGINYVDGGLGYNNPAEVALEEAGKIWPTAKHFYLISIGTGRRRAVQIVDSSRANNDDVTTEHSLFEHVKSFIPSVASFIPGWKTATNFPPGVLALLKIAGVLSKLITDSEHVHQRLRRAACSTDIDKRFPYFRFNVERDVGDIGLEEWRREEEMAAYTIAYLHEQEVEETKMECVECLINPLEFKRMQQIIIVALIVDARTSDAGAPKYFMVPYEKNVFFVGQDDLIDQIFNKLCESKPHQYNHRIALYGMGGVGKTQTALAYVHTLKQNYHSIFWISGATQATLLSGFEQIRTETRCAIEASNLIETAKLVIKWLQEQTNWLLIIDNLDDISVIDGFLPSTECNGHTLITTRNPSTEGIPAQGIEVEILDIETAVQLFRIFLMSRPESEFSDDELEIRTIVKELGCLPLAIEQAAAFIRESKEVSMNIYLYTRKIDPPDRSYGNGYRMATASINIR